MFQHRALPAVAVGDEVTARLDWPRRFARMRIHTGLHLLSTVLPYPVTGGQSATARAGSISTSPTPGSTRTRSPPSSPR